MVTNISASINTANLTASEDIFGQTETNTKASSFRVQEKAEGF